MENEKNEKKKKHKCPVCDRNELTMRYEASYVYSYIIDNDAPGRMNTDEFLSYLYDKRELKESRTYIECNICGTQYPPELLEKFLVADEERIKERALH